MNFNELVFVRHKEIEKETIFFTEKTRLWCQLPYPKHPKGCMNYNNQCNCPPKSKYRVDILKKYDTFILVYALFDFKKYKELRLKEHEDWSDSQSECVLYWQKSVVKMMKEYILLNFKGKYQEIFGSGSGFFNAPSMESAGMYVFKTLKCNNIDFEMKPKDKVVLVSLLVSNKKHPYSLDRFLIT